MRFIKSLFILFLICTLHARRRVKSTNYVDLMVGVGVGYGLGIEATDKVRKCFQKEKAENMVNDLLKKTEETDPIGEIAKAQNGDTQGLVKIIFDFFSNFKDCAPLKDTLLSFVKNKIIKIGFNGLVYFIGGFFGLLATKMFGTYKLVNEVVNFYKVRSSKPLDFLALGTSVGRVIYYAENLLIRRRKLR